MTRARFMQGIVLSCITLGALASYAAAPSFPTKPMQLIIAYPAGGSTDVAARIVASIAEKDFGQSIVVVNKGGAGGQVGWTDMSRQRPDGYTIGFINLPALNTVILDQELEHALAGRPGAKRHHDRTARPFEGVFEQIADDLFHVLLLHRQHQPRRVDVEIPEGIAAVRVAAVITVIRGGAERGADRVAHAARRSESGGRRPRPAGLARGAGQHLGRRHDLCRGARRGGPPEAHRRFAQVERSGEPRSVSA